MEFLHFFGNVLAPDNFAILVFGTVAGLLFGAIPGLSPTMTVALLIPFTFHMHAIGGLILLGAAYTSTVAGGAVSAILLKIPGAPANIATALDGHEMAKKQQATTALHLCFISSAIGGVLGVFVLIFCSPLLATVALDFGPSQLFWVAILGVTVIATLDSSSTVKGLMSGVLGLWLSTIGYDDIQGVERFIFSEHLQSGIHIIPALIGLFAIPQILDMLGDGLADRKREIIQGTRQSIGHSLRLCLGRGKSLGIGSIVGIIIGLIPGAGGQIAGLVSWDQARKMSKHPEKFGTGEPDGLIAAESANNAMVGPSLVPLLTLSVPGSPTAAVLLGGLLIHGIFPGPNLFRDHAEVAWTFVDSLLVGQLLMVIFGIALSGVAAKVLKIPKLYLAPAITVLAVFGTYSVQHSYSDVIVMFALGLAMWLLERMGLRSAPLVLGLVLGGIAETNFVQGAIIAGANDGMARYFLSGGLNISLIALCAASILYSVWSQRRARAANKPTIRAAAIEFSPRTIARRLIQNKPIFILIGLAVGISWASFQGAGSAYIFPKLLAVLLLLTALPELLLTLFATDRAPRSIDKHKIRQLFPGLIGLGIYIFVAEAAGFYAAAAALMAALIFYYAHRLAALTRRKIIAHMLFIAGFLGILYALFSVVLQVQTPTGWLL